MRTKQLRRKNKSPRRNASHRRFLGRRRSLFELLEDRRLLAGDNIFAQFDGNIATSGERAEIPIALSTPDFTFRGSDTLLGFHVRSTGGSLDPAAIEIRNNSGSIVPAIYSATDVPDSPDSLALVKLSAGLYSVFVADEGNGIGSFQLDVFLVGDADGNRAVERADAKVSPNSTPLSSIRTGGSLPSNSTRYSEVTASPSRVPPT